MSEEQNRFSLRKLSVGLASVLIGVSIFGTSQTVKADTVANNQTSSVTNNAQSSDTQKNENAVKSSFSNDNQANNAKSNLIQTQVEGKKDQKQVHTENGQQDSVSKTQEATDSNDLQQKDAEKDIVRASSLQESNNQSNTVTEKTVQHDTLENGQKAQSFNLPKNSKQLNEKVLATNLTETQTQDISKITDPSKIDASHFADGTHWTVAGWTRTDKNTKIAKQSSITLPDSSGYTIDATNLNCTYVTDLNFTLDKNDMKAGNRILVATIQQVPTNAKQDVSNYEKQPRLSTDRLDSLNLAETYQNQEIGTLTATNLDNGEIDFYFNVTKDMPDLINDPSFTNKLDGDFFTTNRRRSWTGFYSYKNNLQYPLHYSIISNSKILNYSIVPPTVSRVDPNQQKANSVFLDYNWNHIQYYYSDIQHQLKNDPTLEGGFVYKITTLKGAKPTFSYIDYGVNAQLLDANGNPIYSGVQIDGAYIPATHKADNLSALDLWNNTSNAQFSYSNQKDGSVIVCFKPSVRVHVNPAITKANAENSYYANVVDPQHHQQIVDNAGKITAPSDWTAWFPINDSSYVDTAYQVTDLTPSGVNVSNSGTMLLQTASTGSSTTSNLETYKNVKITYVDDDNNGNNVSLDSMTGRQNIASTYTVNIPKGYYLDDNNTSTGYTWNADHTQITYTFNEDQAKNDANPITIHLKHIHSAVTDPAQIQSTAKRTIVFHMPDNITQTIVQTIVLKRTGDLDEATNTATYTDWTVDNTNTNVTVNGVKNASMSAYKMNGKKIMFCGFPIPHINGYKATVTRSTNKINPAVAMFTVSFVAVPSENKPSTPVEVAPSKPSAHTDKPNNSAWSDLDHKVIDGLNADDSGWTMPTDNSTYTVEVPADDTIIDLSDLVIAEPVHAQTRTQIRVNKRFKLRKHGKKHIAKHLKHRKKAVKSFKKYRL